MPSVEKMKFWSPFSPWPQSMTLTVPSATSESRIVANNLKRNFLTKCMHYSTRYKKEEYILSVNMNSEKNEHFNSMLSIHTPFNSVAFILAF